MSRIWGGVLLLGLALGITGSPCAWAQDKSTPPPLPGQKGGNGNSAQQKQEKPAPPLPGQKGSSANSAEQEPAIGVEVVNAIPPEDRQNLKGYWAGVANKIGQRWQHTAAAKSAPGSDVVTITGWIHTDGRVTGLKVEHGSGKAAVDRAAMGAISGSAPYDAFPYGIAVEQVKVRFSFGTFAPGQGSAPPAVVH